MKLRNSSLTKGKATHQNQSVEKAEHQLDAEIQRTFYYM